MRLVYIFLAVAAAGIVFGGMYFLRGGDDAPAGETAVLEDLKIAAPPAGTTAASEALPSATDSAATRAVMHTNLGDIILELFPKDAPKTVENFARLARAGFYNGVKFHRVIKGFMAQTGDPNSKDSDWSDDGTGGPGYLFADEINSRKLVRGTLAMANAGPDTNGSQFFIVTAEATSWLDGKHTVFGRVTAGMDVVGKIENTPVDHAQGDHPLQDIVINALTLSER